MFTKSIEEVFVEEIGKRVIGHGHQVDDGDRGSYEGSVISLDQEKIEYSCEEAPDTIFIRIKGACVVQYIDSDGDDHDSDWNIEVEARVKILPASHDISSSEISVRMDVDIVGVNLTSQD
ncbi:hypothetical protein ACDH70_11855 [Xanthomonas axonopodis pv. poinsettiicola]|uniref:hypothetical protein n=1 Tax=Xanthomonas TaxID=338 RepID=UPI001E28662D|nr:hypothetical protein [Xanthomonas codiaei]MCC8535902.1 hypothetical protein [Xanthomonas codiaei]